MIFLKVKMKACVSAPRPFTYKTPFDCFLTQGMGSSENDTLETKIKKELKYNPWLFPVRF